MAKKHFIRIKRTHIVSFFALTVIKSIVFYIKNNRYVIVLTFQLCYNVFK